MGDPKTMGSRLKCWMILGYPPATWTSTEAPGGKALG